MKPLFLSILNCTLLAALMAFGLVACTKSDHDFVTSLERSAQAVKNTPAPTVTVSSVTDFDWDSLFIFAPYTPVDKIHAQLGFKWSGAEKSHIDSSDAFYLLVFVTHGKVVRHLKFPRTIGSFLNLETGNAFSPDDDAFEVKWVHAGGNKRMNFLPKRKEQLNPK